MPERKKNVRLSTKRKTAQSLERSVREKIMDAAAGLGIDNTDEGGSESTHRWRPERDEEQAQVDLVLPKQEPKEGEGEFWEPIPLDGIPKQLQARMYEVAPMLRGRDAVYCEEFFHKVVGLCNEGCEVDKAANEAKVTAEEVSKKWKPSIHAKHRFPIASCLDLEQAACFTEHFARVYGGRPDNEAFSWKFLTACFATFVHNHKVNWAAEAAKRRQSRVERSLHNPRKLGPVALHQQVRALCRLIAKYARPSVGQSNKRAISTAELAAKEDLRTCSESHIVAEEGHTKMLERLEEARYKFAVLCSEEEPLEQAWGIAIAAHKSLKQDGLLVEANGKNKEARILLCKMKEHSDKQEMAESEMKKLEEEELPKIKQKFKEATENLLAAKEKLRQARISNLVLHPKQPFPILPLGHSIPTVMSNQVMQLCCNCSLGFVSRSFVSACCGCLFHPTCFANMLQEEKLTCPQCSTEFDGPMLAQWGSSLTEKMKLNVQSIALALENPTTTDGNDFCVCPREDTPKLEPWSQSKRPKTMPPPTTPTGLQIASYKASPVDAVSLKPQTPCTGINVSIKSMSPSDMHFRVSNRAQEGIDKSACPTSLTDLGYSSARTIELFPYRKSLFQATECSEPIDAGSSSQVLDGDTEKIEIIISRICESA